MAMGRIFKYAAAGVVGLIAFQCASIFSGSPSSTTPRVVDSVALAAKAAQQAPSAEDMVGITSWRYEKGTSPTEDKPTQTATLLSTESLQFDFPYNGTNYGQLLIRRHPTEGVNALLRIKKGQILCRSDECALSVRFDDGKPIRFSGSPPSDHSSTTVFFNDEARFIAGAKKAKRILVQFDAFQNGRPVLEFKASEPLTWPPK